MYDLFRISLSGQFIDKFNFLKVRAKLSKIFCRKKNETETESLTKDDEKP